MFKKILNLILKHKIITGIIVIVLLTGGYYGYKLFANTNKGTRYVLASVEKGTIIVSVSGTGQISASNQVDVKPKTSGDLIYVGVENGQDVKTGTLIAKIDPADAQKSVNDAQINLNQAQLDLDKMQGIETALGKIRGVKEKAEDNLAKAYEDGFNTVTNTFLNLPTIMTGLQSTLFDYTLSKNSQNIDYYADSANVYNPVAPQYKTNAYNSYQTARTAYDKNFNNYKATNRFSSSTKIESIISETYETLKEVSTAVKDTINLVQLYQDESTKHGITPNTTSTTHLSSLSSYTNTTNNYLSSLLSTKTTIETDKENLIETDYDIADQKIQVEKMQYALDEANKTLSYCWIYAPFDGQIAGVDVEKGDSVSTGTTIATLVTKQMVAEVSLNEVDAAKVKVGQKATLTFDAIEGLEVTGQVAEVDTVGTVSQGVVSYKIKITLDTQDDRVKPGMSVSAAVITDMKQNILMAPSSAVKSQNGNYYVEVFDQIQNASSGNGQTQTITSSVSPKQKSVEIGISNDTYIEITNGLSEGDYVVTRTNTTTTTTNSPRSFFETGGPQR